LLDIDLAQLLALHRKHKPPRARRS
jgi:hypothetical protein